MVFTFEQLFKVFALLAQDDISKKEDREVVELLKSKVKLSESEAFWLVVFIPIILTRRLLIDKFEFPDYYILGDVNGEKKRYVENEIYRLVNESLSYILDQGVDKELILKVAGRSAELRAINQLMLNGNEMDGVNITPLVVLDFTE